MNSVWPAIVFGITLANLAAIAGVLSRRRADHTRLALLGELGGAAGVCPHPDQAMAAGLERLRQFFAAADCLVALPTPDGMRIVAARAPGTGEAWRSAGLLDLPDDAGLLCRPRRFGGRTTSRIRVDAATPLPQRARTALRAQTLGAELGCSTWLSVPAGVNGRLYLLAPGRRAGTADILLLRQAATVIAAQAAMLGRIERLADETASRERSRISLDLHDGAIQPYLGLKLGLEALQRKLRPGDPLTDDVDELCRMTQDSIDELRGYVRVLDGRAQEHPPALRDGLRRQAERFGRFYGIEVATNLAADVETDEPLTTQVLQMIGESLSNIGRHTASRQATINVSTAGRQLRAEVVNQGSDGDDAWRDFRPASLDRRARALGGRIDVAPRAGGGSAVTMTLPL